MINAVGRLYPGCVAGLPYVDELVRRLRLDGRRLAVGPAGRGTVRVLSLVLEDEVVRRDATGPLRITADGLQWPPGRRR
jgi:hypothetical protein